MATIRVVLAEDNALLREGISRLIDGERDFELVGVASDLPELLALIEEATPDVVVTDIRMPPTGTDEGIQAAAWLREHQPEVGVVVLSQYTAPPTRWRSSRTARPAAAYLLKEQVAGADELAQAIRDRGRSGGLRDRPADRRRAGRGRVVPPHVRPVLAHPAGVRDPGRDGPGQEQCRDRRLAPGLGAGGREAHQLDLLQARPDRGAGRQPPGQGGAAST